MTPPSGPASPDNEDDQVPDVSPEPEKLNRQRQRPDVENDVYDPENDDHEVPLPRAKQTRTPRRAIPVPVEAEGEVVLDGEEEEGDEDCEVSEGNRQRYRNQRCRRKDRFVTGIDSALDPGNYNPIAPPDKEVIYVVPMTADPVNNEPASEVTWTNMPPAQTTRRAAEDVMYKGQIKFSLFTRDLFLNLGNCIVLSGTKLEELLMEVS